MNTAGELLREEGGIWYEVVRGVPADVATLLGSVDWGTSGFRYRVLSMDQLLGNVGDVRFIVAYRDGRLIGCLGIAPRRMVTPASNLTAHFISLFAVAPGCGGRGFGWKMAETARRLLVAESNAPVLAYAYVEPLNERSSRVARRAGFEPLAQLLALLVSRTSPRERVPLVLVADLTEEQRRGLEAADRELYADHARLAPATGRMTAATHAVVEQGEVIAAAHVAFEHWSVTAMPGASGALAQYVLPRVPVLGRVVNPRNHRFLRVGAPFARPGRERTWVELVETALHQHGIHTAMILLDERSPFASRLLATGALGVLHRLGMSSEVQLIGGAHGIDGQLTRRFERPLRLCHLDGE